MPAACSEPGGSGLYNGRDTMISAILRAVFGTKHERDVKRMQPVVAQINALEPDMQHLDDAGLAAKTDELRKRVADGETVDDVLPEAFAVCREAARRRLGMRHFDVQLIGGMVLHEGTIAEMATGEGKTLVATLPAYLNALPGRGVHIVTVNDYLAKRDAQWMGPIYQALGLSVGVIQHEASFTYDPAYVTSDIRMTALRPIERREAYRCDITYGTNNEFGFDYLRDNMRFSLEELVQRAAALRHRRRGGLDPHRRGAHAADHLGAVRRVHRSVLPDRPDHPQAEAGGHHHGGQALRDRGPAGRRLHRGREVARRCRSPSRASPPASGCSASTTCTTPSTSTSCTTSSRGCARTRCFAATWTTWSRTARSSSSTSSPAA